MAKGPSARARIRIKEIAIIAIFVPILVTSAFAEAAISIGTAPKGNAKAVATRIIKENFPSCKKVLAAERRPDGSISAKCNGANFLVFTVSDREKAVLWNLR